MTIPIPLRRKAGQLHGPKQKRTADAPKMCRLICGRLLPWPPSRPAPLARVLLGLQPQPNRGRGALLQRSGTRVSDGDVMLWPPERNVGHPPSRYAIRPCSGFPERHLSAEAGGSYTVRSVIPRETFEQEISRRILSWAGKAGHGIVGRAVSISSGPIPRNGIPWLWDC